MGDYLSYLHPLLPWMKVPSSSLAHTEGVYLKNTCSKLTLEIQLGPKRLKSPRYFTKIQYCSEFHF